MNNQVNAFTQKSIEKPLFNLNQVSFQYQNNHSKLSRKKMPQEQHCTPALTGVQLAIQKGERWSIIGPSGCGKSTLLYLLAGLLQPTDGSIYYKELLHLQANPEIALILQDYGLFPWKTVYENVALGLRLKQGKEKSIDGHYIKTQVEAILKRFGIFEKATKYPSQLSGGQKQRVAIARALILKPKVLLMDEPFAALDAITKEDLKNFLLAVCGQENLTLIFVTHNIEEAVEIGDKIIIFGQKNGTISKIVTNRVNTCLQEDYSQAFYQQCDELRKYLGISHYRAEQAGDDIEA